MKTKRVLAAVAIGFASALSWTALAQERSLYVYSTIDALLAGAYDGEISVEQLAKRGDFGIGTYNRLDGEMIVLEGEFFQAKGDGSVALARREQRVPLAYVMPFKRVDGYEIKGTSAQSIEALQLALDARIENKNIFYGVKVRGDFVDVRTRAIPAQSRPYRPLAALVTTQPVFEQSAVKGTLVGIRSPAFSRGVSVPGWHWHFISDDRRFGGHVLAGNFVQGSVDISPANAFHVELPLTDDFARTDQSIDRSKDLQRVESDKR